MRRPSLHLLLAALVLTVSAATTHAQSRKLDDYALFATEQLRSRGMTVHAGDVGVNLGQLYAGGPILASTSTLVASTTRLASGSSCKALLTDALVGAGPACGPLTPFTGPILDGDVGAACHFPNPFPACSTDRVIVAGGASRVLPPGTYGDVLVMGGGGGSGTLVLKGGEYRFCSMRLSRGARVVFDSASQVFVGGDLRMAPLAQAAPAAASSVGPAGVNLFVAGTRVRVSRGARLAGRLCAPAATLGASGGATLDGSFVARRIRTDRIVVDHTGFSQSTSTTTVTSSTAPPSTTTTSTTSSTVSTSTTVTTTSLPQCTPAKVCGDGTVQPECGEECDVGSAESAFVSDACPICAHCRCVTTTVVTSTIVTTTIVVTSTSTTLPADCPQRCGNNVIDADCNEQCDGSAVGALVSGTCGTCVQCRCTTAPVEICGNCIDDDGNGLTDFEDPACCSQTQASTMELKRARLRPRGTASRLFMRAFLARNGMDSVSPTTEDVFFQVRTTSGELLCAKVPASAFKKRRSTFKFRDKKHKVPTAAALDHIVIRVRKNHTVVFRATGRKVPVTTPAPGSLRLTVGFRNASTAESTNQCSSVRSAEFRTARKGAIRFP